jgi:hypothetical protein
MGYLDNSSVTVDAILTLKGRELLAKGGSEFTITQFALGDDEIDYALWNTDHPMGTGYYGTIIENMPILEAVPDETQALRYKLITLPKATQNIPVVSVGNTSITLTATGQIATISPATINSTGNSTLGYTAMLSDSTVCDLLISRPLSTPFIPSVPRYIGDNADAQTITVSGFEFQVRAKTQLIEDKTATITIIANETGGSITVNVLVKKATVTSI